MELTNLKYDAIRSLKGENLYLKSLELWTYWIGLSDRLATLWLDRKDLRRLLDDVIHDGGDLAGLLYNYNGWYEKGKWDRGYEDAVQVCILKFMPFFRMAEYICHMEKV